ncbi:hypothetical protein GCM10009845_21810 [Pedococcus bigeumensis]
MTEGECAAAASGDGRVYAVLMELACALERGWPLWHALPHAFSVAGEDPFDAVVRLATREWRVSALLGDLLAAEPLALVSQGEEKAELVAALRKAAKVSERAGRA